MKKKPQHGGKRKGAGRKPGSPSQSAAQPCPTCVILLDQLKDAKAREVRLMKALENKDEQIGQVITSKFETFNFAGEKPANDVAPGLPLDMLQDVNTYDDEQFLKAAEGVAYPDKAGVQ